MQNRLRKSACSLGLFLLAACGGTADNDRGSREAATVTAAKVRYLPEQRRIEAIGTARARTSAEIYPETAGRVTAVLFRGGDYVQAGDPLVRLDSQAEQLAVDLARISVREAKQLLGRYRRIEDTGAISASQIEQGETALTAAQIELRQAEVALADRTVRAPFSGNVGFTEVDIGDRVTTDTVIAQLDNRSTLYVDFDAPEAVYEQLHSGTMVEITPYALPDRTLNARVIETNSTVSPEQRTFTVRTSVPNRGDMLRPGMSFRVVLELEGRTLPAVPEEAIVWGSDGAHLFRIADGRARQVPLTIVSRRDGMALVDAQLPPNARIVAEGVQKVRDGAPVQIVRAPPQPAIRATPAGGSAATPGPADDG